MRLAPTWPKATLFIHEGAAFKCFPNQPPRRLNLRIQVLVLPDAGGELPNDARVQNQVVDEALVTCGTKQFAFTFRSAWPVR